MPSFKKSLSNKFYHVFFFQKKSERISRREWKEFYICIMSATFHLNHRCFSTEIFLLNKISYILGFLWWNISYFFSVIYPRFAKVLLYSFSLFNLLYFNVYLKIIHKLFLFQKIQTINNFLLKLILHTFNSVQYFKNKAVSIRFKHLKN